MMLSVEFDTLVRKLSVPPAYISGPQSPQGTRAVDVLRWARSAHKICDLDDVLDEIVGEELMSSRL